MEEVQRKTILLTGPMGVVGTALRKRLDRHDLICLAHNDPVEGDRADEVVHGSVTEPRLGLDSEAYADLAQRVDAVLHCAAITDYTASREDMFAVNVGGVQRAAGLARDAEAQMFHVSTAFVDAAPIEVDETKGSRDVKKWWNPDVYLDSKRAAEDALAESGVPAVVMRPSIVFGDSYTGETAHFQGMHVLMRLFFESSLPLMPLDPKRHIDFVPQDVLADMMAAIIDLPFAARDWWLTSGERALNLDDLMRVGTAYLDEIGSPILPPRVVPPDMVDRLIRPVFLPALPARLRRRFEQLMNLEPLFFHDGWFKSDLPELEQVTGTPSDLRLEPAYVAAIAYWLAQKELRKQVAEVAI